jgi:hypothetical protein
MTLTVLWVGFAILFCAASVVFVRWLVATETGGARTRKLAMFASLSVAAFAGRMYQAADRVSALPYLDQWKADIAELAVPLTKGRPIGLGDLVRNHHEHRVLPTRLATVGLIKLNGEWDNRPLVVMSLAVQSLAFGWFATFGLFALGGWRGGLLAAMTMIAPLLCSDWENIVSGFQSQFHFTVLGSLIIFTVLAQERPWTLAGVSAVLVALLLLVTLGSGAVAAFAMAGAWIATSLIERRLTIAAITVSGVGLAIFGLGLALRPEFHAHDFLHAKSAAHWRDAFLMYAGWPYAPRFWNVLLLWLPTLLLLGRCIRRREVPAFGRVILALACWVMVQAAVLAWSRAEYYPAMSSRYTGLLIFSGMANAAAAVCLFDRAAPTGRLRAVLIGAVVVWCGALANQWIARSRADDFAFRQFRTQTVAQENRIVEFLLTEKTPLILNASFPDIPYPVAQDLLQWFRDPDIRAVLPASLRRAAFRHDHPGDPTHITAGPLTAVSKALLQFGFWLALPALAVAAWAAGSFRRVENQ